MEINNKTVGKKTIAGSVLWISLFLLLCISHLWCCETQNTAMRQDSPIKEPLEYKLLFFRNDGRIWIVLPPRTTMLLVHPYDGTKNGYVKAINRHGEVLAEDNSFKGGVQFSTAVENPSIRQNLIAVTRHNGRTLGIYTPEDARYIEIINATNGFDGSIRVRDWKKRVIAGQWGLDLEVVDYASPR